MRNQRRPRGFTLIELLVVIAIIAILAAILFPVFAQARDKARSATCLSNMKQIGLGLMMYAQDFDEILPFNYNYSADRTALYWWEDVTQPYIKSQGIFVCPSASPHTSYTFARPPGLVNPLVSDFIANAQGPSQANFVVNGINYGSSAGSNLWGPFLNSQGVAGTQSRSLAFCEDPAGTIGMFDGRSGQFEIYYIEQVDAFYNATGKCSSTSSNTPEATGSQACPEGRIRKRHSDGYNAAFMDGHAKFVKNSTLGMWTARAGD